MPPLNMESAQTVTMKNFSKLSSNMTSVVLKWRIWNYVSSIFSKAVVRKIVPLKVPSRSGEMEVATQLLPSGGLTYQPRIASGRKPIVDSDVKEEKVTT